MGQSLSKTEFVKTQEHWIDVDTNLCHTAKKLSKFGFLRHLIQDIPDGPQRHPKLSGKLEATPTQSDLSFTQYPL